MSAPDIVPLLRNAVEGWANEAADEIDRLRAEVERMTQMTDPEVTFRELETSIRDGKFNLRMIGGEDGGHPAMRFLAALMWHFVLGEDNVEPPNYRSADMTLKPAGGFEELRAAIEVIKPGGKSSHQIRVDLEAEVKRMRPVIEAAEAWLDDVTPYADSRLAAKVHPYRRAAAVAALDAGEPAGE